jgi:hypothetical protein
VSKRIDNEELATHLQFMHALPLFNGLDIIVLEVAFVRFTSVIMDGCTERIRMGREMGV